MDKKRKLSEAVDASMYRYPYQNLSTVNMSGEIWKPMPDYEDYYMVSNKGRVKSLPREISQFLKGNFITYTTEEIIKKQFVCKYSPKRSQKYSYYLSFNTKINRKSRGYSVARIVYETFVGPIPDKMIIQHKNGDSFDNSIKNLYAVSVKEAIMKRYEEGNVSEIVISQYDREGNYIKTYRSLSHAAKAMGVQVSNFTGVIQGKRMLCKGYHWRRGDSKDKIDMSFLEERIRRSRQIVSENKSKKVVQYDLTGKFVAVHNSIKKAKAQTGIPLASIKSVLYGKNCHAYGFIWKYADSFDEIPDRIEVEEPELPETVVFTKSRKEMNLPEYEYPYQDLHLCDLENEVWKAVPGLEEYCMISNMGRVKAFSRFIKRPNRGREIAKERIIKQAIRRPKSNQYTGKLNQYLYFRIGIDNIYHQMAVGRTVYSTFIKPLKDFKEDKIYILHRDLNPFNNRVENLYAATQKEVAVRNIKESMEKLTLSRILCK